MRMTELQKALLGSFSAGTVDPVVGEQNMCTAGIDISTEPSHHSSSGTWWSQIECHAHNQKDAEALRDFVLRAIHEKIAHMTMEEFRVLT